MSLRRISPTQSEIYMRTSNKITRLSLLVALVLFVVSFASAQTQTEKTVSVFGAKIAYVEAGDPSKPTVILLHGSAEMRETGFLRFLHSRRTIMSSRRIRSVRKIGSSNA
jgi:hypothetical protein